MLIKLFLSHTFSGLGTYATLNPTGHFELRLYNNMCNIYSYYVCTKKVYSDIACENQGTTIPCWVLSQCLLLIHITKIFYNLKCFRLHYKWHYYTYFGIIHVSKWMSANSKIQILNHIIGTSLWLLLGHRIKPVA